MDYRERIAFLEGKKNFHLHYGDMSDSMGLVLLQHKANMDEMVLFRIAALPRPVQKAPIAFSYVGIELEFTGEGIEEKGVDKATGKVFVEVSPDFYRPTDVINLLGDFILQNQPHTLHIILCITPIPK